MQIKVPTKEKQPEIDYTQLLRMVSPPNLTSKKVKIPENIARRSSLGSNQSSLDSEDEERRQQLAVESALKQKKSSKNVVVSTDQTKGYSNLIKREFFNREPPKRQPMKLVQYDLSQKTKKTPTSRISSLGAYIKRQTVRLPRETDEMSPTRNHDLASKNVSVDITSKTTQPLKQQKNSVDVRQMRLDPEMERQITRQLERQKEINNYVETLLQENSQSVSSHHKFKQMIGYRDKKVDRLAKTTALKNKIPGSHPDTVIRQSKNQSQQLDFATVALQNKQRKLERTRMSLQALSSSDKTVNGGIGAVSRNDFNSKLEQSATELSGDPSVKKLGLSPSQKQMKLGGPILLDDHSSQEGGSVSRQRHQYNSSGMRSTSIKRERKSNNSSSHTEIHGVRSPKPVAAKKNKTQLGLAVAAIRAYIDQLGESLLQKCNDIQMEQMLTPEPILKQSLQSTLNFPKEMESQTEEQSSHLPEIKRQKVSETSPSQFHQTKSELRATRAINAFKDKVRDRVNLFIEALLRASHELSGDPSAHTINDAVQTLSKVRSTGASKHNQGLILLDQYFSVPQIGELIRDLFLLLSLAENISKTANETQMRHKISKESFQGEVMMIPEEDNPSLYEIFKQTDPALIQPLLALKNNSAEGQLTLLLSRAKSIVTKYTSLAAQLRIHGVDFILATGKTSPKVPGSRQDSQLKSVKKMSKGNKASHSGFFSSLDRVHAQKHLQYHQSSLMNKNVSSKRIEESSRKKSRVNNQMLLHGTAQFDISAHLNMDDEIQKSQASIPIREGNQGGDSRISMSHSQQVKAFQNRKQSQRQFNRQLKHQQIDYVYNTTAQSLSQSQGVWKTQSGQKTAHISQNFKKLTQQLNQQMNVSEAASPKPLHDTVSNQECGEQILTSEGKDSTKLGGVLKTKKSSTQTASNVHLKEKNLIYSERSMSPPLIENESVKVRVLPSIVNKSTDFVPANGESQESSVQRLSKDHATSAMTTSHGVVKKRHVKSKKQLTQASPQRQSPNFRDHSSPMQASGRNRQSENESRSVMIGNGLTSNKHNSRKQRLERLVQTNGYGGGGSGGVGPNTSSGQLLQRVGTPSGANSGLAVTLNIYSTQRHGGGANTYGSNKQQAGISAKNLTNNRRSRLRKKAIKREQLSPNPQTEGADYIEQNLSQ